MKTVSFSSGENSAKIVIFDGTNFDDWREDCMLTLMFRDLWGVVTLDLDEQLPVPDEGIALGTKASRCHARATIGRPEFGNP